MEDGNALYEEMLDLQDQAIRLSSELMQMEDDGLEGTIEYDDLAEEINDLENDADRIEDELQKIDFLQLMDRELKGDWLKPTGF